MDLPLLWRAAAVQLVAVAALFGLLVALPLPGELFSDYGAVIGPLSWLACALVTGRLLALGTGRALICGVASGAIAGLVGLLGGHAAGLAVGVVLFGGAAAASGEARRRLATQRSWIGGAFDP